ncbi:unnamed protein product [Microthlaspi erraticum]|uniref:Uncharacterized protein n=1 Tax=Microthlaspi erraticum TaxID=1685480 RepID=A0A6D2J610_9BRAS|nr:unnamed protein product [Microthlaspi erraticum]
MDIKFCKTNLSLSTRSWMGGSNSSSHIHWLDPPSFSCPTLSSPQCRGENIDFRPPVYTLVGHEEDLREEEPELDRAEDRAEDQAQIGLLQKFNKWQGKAIEKMQKSMDKMVTPHHPRRLPAQEPHRASSFEPREGEDNTQRRRKSSKARRSRPPDSIESKQRNSIELRVELTWRSPSLRTLGFEYDQPSTRTSLRAGLPTTASSEHSSTKAKEATHFEDEEEEEEEEPQARSSEPNPVAWSAPDGRLPSPDHDLASQFFGGH